MPEWSACCAVIELCVYDCTCITLYKQHLTIGLRSPKRQLICGLSKDPDIFRRFVGNVSICLISLHLMIVCRSYYVEWLFLGDQLILSVEISIATNGLHIRYWSTFYLMNILL